MMHNPYSHAPADYVCPLCAIARGDNSHDGYSLQSDVIYHNDQVTALIASHQYKGNTPNVLVIPNEHFENIFELPAPRAADIQRVARAVAFALKESFQCDGISTRQHNEPAGSQDVWHYHLHVTPRFTSDRFYDRIYHKELLSDSERAIYANQLRKTLRVE